MDSMVMTALSFCDSRSSGTRQTWTTSKASATCSGGGQSTHDRVVRSSSGMPSRGRWRQEDKRFNDRVHCNRIGSRPRRQRCGGHCQVQRTTTLGELHLQCAKCGFANREGRRFCSECGAALAGPCAACGFVNDPGEKFCGGCGIALASASPPRAAEPAPPATPAWANGRPELVEAARRQLTVMFCDLVGSTALSQQLDPEELTDVLTAYQDTCAQVIKHFDGYIGRYVGDALLVYFGYPQAHEDDAQRAVRTALAIVEAVKALNFTLERPEGTLAVRIGIATGLVVISDIGRGERREKAAIVGETPNLAARLQGLAGPDEVAIAPTTRRLVGAAFQLSDMGPHVLKGIAQPVRAWRAHAVHRPLLRFEAAHDGVAL